MIPILAGRPIRYWLAILARYWQGSRSASDTGRRGGFDTGSGSRPILAGIPVSFRYWLPILALSILACAGPGWAADATQAPTETAPPLQEDPGEPRETLQAPKPGPTPERAPQSLRETVSALQSLNVRTGGSERTPVLGVLYHGSPVSLTGECLPGWVQIRYKSRLAWVNARYVTGDLCEEEE